MAEVSWPLLRHLARELAALPDPAPGHLPRRLEFACYLVDRGKLDDWPADGGENGSAHPTDPIPLGDLVDLSAPAPGPAQPWRDGSRYHIPVVAIDPNNPDPIKPPRDEPPRWDDEGREYA